MALPEVGRGNGFRQGYGINRLLARRRLRGPKACDHRRREGQGQQGKRGLLPPPPIPSYPSSPPKLMTAQPRHGRFLGEPVKQRLHEATSTDPAANERMRANASRVWLFTVLT